MHVKAPGWDGPPCCKYCKSVSCYLLFSRDLVVETDGQHAALLAPFFSCDTCCVLPLQKAACWAAFSFHHVEIFSKNIQPWCCKLLKFDITNKIYVFVKLKLKNLQSKNEKSAFYLIWVIFSYKYQYAFKLSQAVFKVAA
ncbi:hypothetical protein CRENBAI_025448 [Crenichthys baileyi]|uniref:Uncharacterized protein n=1 Tax=Crenichthys baileyi TaxID=28760 RepID=A0AAV9QX98_9TELE